LNEEMLLLGQEIIGNLDDDGYLKRSLSEIINELLMFANAISRWIRQKNF